MQRVTTSIIVLLWAYNGGVAADEAVFVEKGDARSVREIGKSTTLSFSIDGKTLIAFIHNRYDPGRLHFDKAARNELWSSVSKDEGRTWSEPRFVFAGATPGGHIHSCSYIDMFADGSRIHIFLGQAGRQLLYLHFDESDLARFPTEAELTASTQNPPAKTIDVEASLHAVAELTKYLEAAPADRLELAEQEFVAVALTQKHAIEAQRLLWNAHIERIKQTRADEMETRQLISGNLQMPFYYTVSGDKPKSGRSLYISLHGGGGAPKQVNDRQWENQKRLYQVTEGVYLVPRAPTNAWNMWHQAHIDGLFHRLIENLIVFEEVDPNRVYLLGYSAGGDGVYQLAPRMADRFAAAAMMSGHPNEASPLALRNVAFTIHAGGKDSAYNRNKVARQWGQKLDDLQKEDPEGYVHWTKIYESKGHWLDRQDAAALPWMAKHTRNPLPTRIVWRQDNVTHSRFYWLAVKRKERHTGVEVRASLKGQTFDVQADGINQLIIRANDRMLNLDEDVTIVSQGKELYKGRIQRSIGTLAKTLAERGDPGSVFSGEIAVILKTD